MTQKVKSWKGPSRVFPASLTFFFFKSYFYLFLAVLGLHCCAGSSLVASGGSSPVLGHGLLVLVASRHGAWAPEHRLRNCGAWP